MVTVVASNPGDNQLIADGPPLKVIVDGVDVLQN